VPVLNNIYEDYEETWVVVRDTTGMGGTEFNIGFEGSQALPVCPSGKCKRLTGTIEVSERHYGWGRV
jgi:hypothetical protein